MKSLALVLIAIISVCILITSPVLAHPGNTDASGGHTCRTNCESWGLSYGEYHYHNTGYYEDDYYDQGSEAGLEFVDENSLYIVSNAENKGQADGTEDGSSGYSEDESPDSDSICSDVDFQNTSSPQDYYDGFMDSYSDSCRDVYNEKYSSSYATAYAAALELYEENLASDEAVAGGDTEDSDWIIALLPYAIIGILIILITNWDAIKSWWKNL